MVSLHLRWAWPQMRSHRCGWGIAEVKEGWLGESRRYRHLDTGALAQKRKFFRGRRVGLEGHVPQMQCYFLHKPMHRCTCVIAEADFPALMIYRICDVFSLMRSRRSDYLSAFVESLGRNKLVRGFYLISHFLG